MGIKAGVNSQNGFLPVLLPRFVHRQVVVDAQRAMVVQRFQQVECFGGNRDAPCPLIGADIEVADSRGVDAMADLAHRVEWSSTSL